MAIGDIVTQVLRCVCVKVLQYDQERLHNPSMNDAMRCDRLRPILQNYADLISKAMEFTTSLSSMITGDTLKSFQVI
ncbi:MAG TPA: hypothetical protein V6D25_21250 [Leptolyngbyaceae cyanobacterium]